MRNDTSAQKKKRTIAGNYSVESQNDGIPNGPTLEVVHQLWTQPCGEESRILQHRSRTKVSTRFAGRAKKNGTFFKTKVKSAVISRTGISREEAEYTVDSGASMQITSRNDCIVEEHDTFRTSKESGTIISAWCVCVCMVARFLGTESFALRASSCWLPCWLANVGSPSQLRTQTNETPPHL